MALTKKKNNEKMQLFRGTETVLAISDQQAPFHHPDAIAFLKAVKQKFQPTKVVNIGDSLDMHCLSKYSHNPDLPGPADEYRQALDFMHELYDLFPVAQEVYSNHNGRYLKRIEEAGIPSSFIKSYRQIMDYPKGWSIEPYLEIDNVLYEHGTRFGGLNSGRSALQVNGQSTVYGHLHSNGGIVYSANRKELIFAMCVGCLIDWKAYAFNYARDAKQLPTLGTGVVVKGVPHFVPMFIDKEFRWTGEL